MNVPHMPASQRGRQPLFGDPMIGHLDRAYRELEQCLAHMEQVTSAMEPDMVALASARYRLSRVSHARRRLVQQACDHLLAVAPGAAPQVIALQRRTIAYVRSSNEHIRDWPPLAIERDWAGYRTASLAIRARMRDNMRSEHRLVLALLGGASEP